VKRGLSIELDVYLSSDGVPVVIHDGTLDRTTNGTGRVTQTPLAELKKLDAGSWYDKKFSDQRIPTFEEVLAMIQAKDKAKAVHDRHQHEGDLARHRGEGRGAGQAVRHDGPRVSRSAWTRIRWRATRRLIRRSRSAGAPRTPPSSPPRPPARARSGSGSAPPTTATTPPAPKSTPLASGQENHHLLAEKPAGTLEAARAAGVDAICTDFPIEAAKTLGGKR
jgi:hypothetical protein